MCSGKTFPLDKPRGKRLTSCVWGKSRGQENADSPSSWSFLVWWSLPPVSVFCNLCYDLPFGREDDGQGEAIYKYLRSRIMVDGEKLYSLIMSFCQIHFHLCSIKNFLIYSRSHQSHLIQETGKENVIACVCAQPSEVGT